MILVVGHFHPAPEASLHKFIDLWDVRLGIGIEGGAYIYPDTLSVDGPSLLNKHQSHHSIRYILTVNSHSHILNATGFGLGELELSFELEWGVKGMWGQKFNEVGGEFCRLAGVHGGLGYSDVCEMTWGGFPCNSFHLGLNYMEQTAGVLLLWAEY